MKIAVLYNKYEREYEYLKFLCDKIVEYSPGSETLLRSYSQCGWEELFNFQPDIYFAFPITVQQAALKPYVMKLFFNSKVILYRTEGAVGSGEGADTAHIGFSRYGAALVDSELFWGDRPCSLLGSILSRQGKVSSRDRCATVGYLRYEQEVSICADLPQHISEKLEFYSRNKICTFLTGFQFSDYSDEDMALAGDLFDPTAQDAGEALTELCQMREYTQIIRERWITSIIKTATQNPDCLVVVKPHPVEMEQWACGIPNVYRKRFLNQKNIFLIQEPCSASGLIKKSAVLIHYGSTCLADSYLFRTFSIQQTAEDIRSAIKSTSYARFFSTLDWPSHQDLDAEEVPRFIEENKTKFTPAPVLPGMEKMLLDNFDFRFSESYSPSAKIITIVFSKDKFPTQSIKDSPQDIQCFRELIKDHPKEIAKAVRAARHAIVRNLKSGNFVGVFALCRGLLHLLFLRLQARRAV